MHPAYSVIFFTVLSGAGFGLLALLPAATMVGIEAGGCLGLVGFGIGIGLSSIGLLLSLLHLRHPERAWRALSQWRSSWLSREGVIAVAALAFVCLHAFLLLFLDKYLFIAGACAIVLSLGTVFATGMIYAQLRTVGRWNTILTPLCFIGFSISGGALLFAFASSLTATGMTTSVAIVLAVASIVASWMVKALWWKRGDALKPLSTSESATGLGRIGQVRLFESPHSGESYLTREMGYKIARKHALKLRSLAFVAGCLIPAALAAIAYAAPGTPVWLLIALVFYFAGTLTERWLFFAESEHSVSAYY